jgi:predicted amidohydrolase YtcJ
MRKLLLIAVAAVAAAASLAAQGRTPRAGRGADAQAGVDLAIVNAVVYTVDAERPAAEALAIAGDRIVAVGTSAEIRRLAGPRTRLIDARGGFVTPGFNDAHVHIDSTGALLVGVNLLDVHEPTAFRERIAAAAARLPRGAWITRGEWGAYEQWGAGSSGAAPAGARAAEGPFTPSRDLIDAVTPEHPVLVNRFDRSMYLANTRALEMAGITAATPDPPGGEIVKDGAGRPSGILKGTAAELVRKVQTPISFEQRLVQVRAVLQEAREGGITTMQDLTTPEQLIAYQALQRRGELTARISIRPQLWEVEHVQRLGISRGFGDDWLRVAGYKAWVDGIMGNSGALFFRAYDHNPNNRGYTRHIMHPEPVEGAALQMTEKDHYTRWPAGNMEKLIREAVKTGIPPHVHAIGDQGVRMLLDIYERVLTEEKLLDADHRWRMIHAQVVHPDDFPRFGKLKLVAEVNPYHVSDDMRWMEERIGKERSKGAYAFRKLKYSGATLIFGSDSPGTNAARYYLSPVYGLYAAVTRQTLTGEPREGWFPDQRLTIEESIEAYTKGPAWATFEEHLKGTVTPGKLADVAVFDTNLIEAGRKAPAQLLKAKVLYTIVGGKIVFERPAATAPTHP